MCTVSRSWLDELVKDMGCFGVGSREGWQAILGVGSREGWGSILGVGSREGTLFCRSRDRDFWIPR